MKIIIGLRFVLRDGVRILQQRCVDAWITAMCACGKGDDDKYYLTLPRDTSDLGKWEDVSFVLGDNNK